jgi:uncharacterized membrane protein YedE/YeeE
MSANVVGLLFGAAFGFVMAWARLSDPRVIGRMLRLQEFDVFLLMGSAIAVAAIGVRLLRSAGVRALVTKEPIAWKVERPQRHHILGSMVFGVGWSVAGTCPGPVAAMIGQGRLAGIVIVAGLLLGVSAQGALSRRRGSQAVPIVVAPMGM